MSSLSLFRATSCQDGGGMVQGLYTYGAKIETVNSFEIRCKRHLLPINRKTVKNCVAKPHKKPTSSNPKNQRTVIVADETTLVVPQGFYGVFDYDGNHEIIVPDLGECYALCIQDNASKKLAVLHKDVFASTPCINKAITAIFPDIMQRLADFKIEAHGGIKTEDSLESTQSIKQNREQIGKSMVGPVTQFYDLTVKHPIILHIHLTSQGFTASYKKDAVEVLSEASQHRAYSWATFGFGYRNMAHANNILARADKAIQGIPLQTAQDQSIPINNENLRNLHYNAQPTPQEQQQIASGNLDSSVKTTLFMQKTIIACIELVDSVISEILLDKRIDKNVEQALRARLQQGLLSSVHGHRLGLLATAEKQQIQNNLVELLEPLLQKLHISDHLSNLFRSGFFSCHLTHSLNLQQLPQTMVCQYLKETALVTPQKPNTPQAKP